MWSTGYELQAVELRLRQEMQRESHALNDNDSHIAGKMNRSHDERLPASWWCLRRRIQYGRKGNCASRWTSVEMYDLCKGFMLILQYLKP
jgi:hypothetical protein